MSDNTPFLVGDARVDLGARVLVRDGVRHPLTPIEARLLEVLAARSGAVVPSDALLSEVWGYASGVRSSTLPTTVRRLRKKLEPDPSSPRHLITVHRVGYRLDGRPQQPLLGRGRLLAALARRLKRPGAVWLVGGPGVGKTALAAAATRALAAPVESAVLTEARTADSAARAVAEALGVLDPEGADLGRVLAHRADPVLLLDNADDVAAELHELLSRWMEQAPARLRYRAAVERGLDRQDHAGVAARRAVVAAKLGEGARAVELLDEAAKQSMTGAEVAGLAARAIAGRGPPTAAVRWPWARVAVQLARCAAGVAVLLCGGRALAWPAALEVTRTDGSVVTGEPLYVWDQALWHTPSAGRTGLLFDAAAYAPFPGDRSLHIVDGGEVASWSAVAATGPTYAEHARAEGIGITGSPLPGASLVIRGNDGYHLREDGYGDFAWDLVQTDATGARYTGLGIANADYLVWDQPVALPVSGTVVEVERGGTDNPVGTIPPGALNNFVGVALGGHYELVLLHLREGSIPPEVVPGAFLPAGTVIGRVGNSGVTLEPHLHLTVLWLDATPGQRRAWSVPSEWHGVTLSSSPTGPGVWAAHAVPQTGEWVASGP